MFKQWVLIVFPFNRLLIQHCWNKLNQTAICFGRSKPHSFWLRMSPYEDYKRYKDLPIPKLKDSFCVYEANNKGIRLWFEHYEKVIGSTDPVVLKNCLFYYLDESTAPNFALKILAHDYPTIKSIYTQYRRIP